MEKEGEEGYCPTRLSLLPTITTITITLRMATAICMPSRRSTLLELEEGEV